MFFIVQQNNGTVTLSGMQKIVLQTEGSSLTIHIREHVNDLDISQHIINYVETLGRKHLFLSVSIYPYMYLGV